MLPDKPREEIKQITFHKKYLTPSTSRPILILGAYRIYLYIFLFSQSEGVTWIFI